jgi:hypothetical protein
VAFRTTSAFVLLLLFHSTAWGEIALLSSKEDDNPRSTTITLVIRSPNENVQTEMTLRYPGSAKTMVQNGEEKLMLSNKQASIVAFNFRAGTQANDSVALALSSHGRVVYFFDLNHVVAEIVAKWKNGLDEASFRVVDLTNDSIILEYYEHYSAPESLSFRVVAHVLANGDLQIAPADIKDLPR